MIYYYWLYENENENKKGIFTFNESGVIWKDSWHQQKPSQCSNVPDILSLFTVHHTYDVPDNPNWGWQSKLFELPDGSLVLQMTNVTPWGEEGWAVKMVFIREKF